MKEKALAFIVENAKFAAAKKETEKIKNKIKEMIKEKK